MAAGTGNGIVDTQVLIVEIEPLPMVGFILEIVLATCIVLDGCTQAWSGRHIQLSCSG
jgi:hypothetical protein